VASDLEAASAAYQAALKRIEDAVAEVAAARADLPEVRARLAEAIVAAYGSGVKVGEIARVTGYGREQVRRILRRAGVGPDE
jgi:DNA-directed RNA polymerase specialized sigma24 family protein